MTAIDSLKPKLCQWIKEEEEANRNPLESYDQAPIQTFFFYHRRKYILIILISLQFKQIWKNSKNFKKKTKMDDGGKKAKLIFIIISHRQEKKSTNMDGNKKKIIKMGKNIYKTFGWNHFIEIILSKKKALGQLSHYGLIFFS